ncbi:carcinoembryonic antigen-related cell adhesion molecule 2-like isoform X2 [Gopherus flavomarginatus]|uniref:carcinoembryonic antigen-related cell adhesion molecule 2-like isoform X2 n=1 Tax=Gopherus flavomarginatus TaxID=286002 RepID=UPI0021CBB22A|nr:carcinoembryonic antigen-related cell adhesion molecule 2-like isoform X2 [Gopherus flavomarginatus]
MHQKTLHEMLFALLLCLACLLPEVTMDQKTKEVYCRFNTTILLMGTNLNASSVFNVEWRTQLKGREKVSILTYSPGSNNIYINESYRKRVVFSHTSFSLTIHYVTLSDEGIYTLTIQLLNKQQQIDRTRVTVIIPILNVQITSETSAPHQGKNITLNCLGTAGNAMSYSWQKCNQPLPIGNRTILSKENASLTLINIQQSDIGTYRCVAQNALSSGHKDFILQLCAETGVSSWRSCGIYGYPGYLGYAIVLFYIFSLVKRTRKSSSKDQSGARLRR